MKKTQKLKIKKSKAQIQQMKDIYTKALEEDMEYLKHMGDRLFELKFTDFDWNILHLAIWNEKQNLIDYILSQQKGKELLNAKDINQETPLHLASFNKNEKLFDLLVRNGANIDEKNLCEQKPVELINLSEKCNFVNYLKKSHYIEDKRTTTDNNEIKISTSRIREKSGVLSNSPFEFGANIEIPLELTTVDRKRIDVLFGKNLNQNSFFFLTKHQKYLDQE